MECSITWDKFSGNDFVPEALARCCASICKDKANRQNGHQTNTYLQLWYQTTKEIVTDPFNYIHIMPRAVSLRHEGLSGRVSHGMKLVPFHDNINEIFHKDKMDRSEQKKKITSLQ